MWCGATLGRQGSSLRCWMPLKWTGKNLLQPIWVTFLHTRIGSWLRKTRQYRRRSLENFMSDVSEFLQEESRILPARAEMERYLEDTEELDASIAGLEDRIRRLTEAD